MTGSLAGRVGVVTGASRGIGRASARELAARGADVCLVARASDALAATAAEIEGLGRRVLVVELDVTDLDALAAVPGQVVDGLGRLDIVVNNAGGTAPRPLLDTSVGYLERAFHFNVSTAFALTKAAVEPMLEGGHGAVVNISSALARVRARGFLAYGTAKAALSHFTRLAAIDLAPRIRVNAIEVGSVRTTALDSLGDAPELLAQMAEPALTRRVGVPEDIARVVGYLASDESSWVSGKVLQIDGGIEAANVDLGLPDL